MDDWEARVSRPWRERLASGQALVLRTRERGAWLVVVGLVVLAVLSWASRGLTSPFPPAVHEAAGWAGVALFGVVGVPVMAWTLWAAHPAVRVDGDGVRVHDRPYLLARDRGWTRTWRDIDRFEVVAADNGSGDVVAVDRHGATLPLPGGVGTEPRPWAAWLEAERLRRARA